MATPATQRPVLARHLIEQGALDHERIDQASHDAREQGLPLVRYLLDEKLVAPALIAQSAAKAFGLPWVDIRSVALEPDLIDQIDAKLIRRHRALPLHTQDGVLTIAIADPANVAAIDEIRFHTGLSVEPVLANDDALSERIETAIGAVSHDLETPSDAVEVRDSAANEPDDDTPVVRFVNRLLQRAVVENASDIHFEPFETYCRVRFRRDGVLHEVAQPPAIMAARLAARIKVMARLDIAERRLPQDGRLRFEPPDGQAVDFRISTCPTLYGEKLVLRLLNTASAGLAMEALGLTDEQLSAYQTAITRPHGMILVTGPTGSGKTVTLYSGLAQLNQISHNILTVEDPVEINLPGINQVSINPRIGLDFPHGLRAFLRQDPDIMMVGEIRDRETAEIAIKAAQTGHLVLSTLHTNDAPSAIARLANMGIAHWTLAASLSLITAQRLARRLCADCCRAVHLNATLLKQAGFRADNASGLTVYEPVGCSRCLDGYRGRVGIHEVLPMTERITEQTLEGAAASHIAAEARKAGYLSLREAGLEKVRAGLTSLAEIERVTRE